MSIAIGWGAGVPLAMVVCVALALGVLMPLARERAPHETDIEPKEAA